MKRFLMVALLLALCMTCLVSCDALTQEIGKTVSIQALDHLEQELREQGSFDELHRYDDPAELSDLSAKLEEADVELKGEITGALSGVVRNGEHWAGHLSIGLSASEDVDTLMQYYQTAHADMIEEGRMVLVDGGWLISVTISSDPIEQAE